MFSVLPAVPRRLATPESTNCFLGGLVAYRTGNKKPDYPAVNFQISVKQREGFHSGGISSFRMVDRVKSFLLGLQPPHSLRL